MLFLTGATGHTGSYLARQLIARGEAIRCLVHTAAHRTYLPVEAEVVEGSVTEVELCARAMQGATACLHLAHIRHAEAITEACRRAGVARFICLSSTRRFTRFPCESSRAVIAGEAVVERSGLEWTILRPSMIYGDERDNNLARLVKWFERTRLFPLMGGGGNLVQPVFVDDVVAAIEAAMDRRESIGQTYTLAGPEPVSFRELVEQVAAVAHRRPLFVPIPFWAAMAAAWVNERVLHRGLLTRESVRRLLEDKSFDIAPARRQINFSPRGLTEGLRSKRLSIPD